MRCVYTIRSTVDHVCVSGVAIDNIASAELIVGLYTRDFAARTRGAFSMYLVGKSPLSHNSQITSSCRLPRFLLSSSVSWDFFPLAFAFLPSPSPFSRMLLLLILVLNLPTLLIFCD
ncbi:unnamed protein product [Calicophoron daubneyi]|uniref:Uncharacterized protein n=1 Tax=Calicophoron daubneyi TaxID=300641 RepID=A0AAV2T774_CALDB